MINFIFLIWLIFGLIFTLFLFGRSEEMSGKDIRAFLVLVIGSPVIAPILAGFCIWELVLRAEPRIRDFHPVKIFYSMATIFFMRKYTRAAYREKMTPAEVQMVVQAAIGAHVSKAKEIGKLKGF